MLVIALIIITHDASIIILNFKKSFAQIWKYERAIKKMQFWIIIHLESLKSFLKGRSIGKDQVCPFFSASLKHTAHHFYQLCNKLKNVGKWCTVDCSNSTE